MVDSGFWTSLAPIGLIHTVHRAISIVGVPFDLPFKFQFFSSQWVDFPFADQLEIASRVCSLVALRRMDDEIDFSVLGADMIFEILLSGGVVTSLKIVRVRVSDEAEHRLDVRVVGVGDFFHGRHISFADGLLVV